MADANGICCPSGKVDECGVCDGTGNSCSMRIEAQLKVPASLIQSNGVIDAPLGQFFDEALAQIGFPTAAVTVLNVSAPVPGRGNRRRVLLQINNMNSTTAPTSGPYAPAPVAASPPPPGPPEDLYVTVSFLADTNNTGTAPFDSSFVAAQLPSAAATTAANTTTGISLVSTPETSREGLCGNGICEIGERATPGAFDGTCPEDCGPPASNCGAGCGAGGSCLPNTGTCQCFDGYEGTFCKDCSAGYNQVGGTCVISVTDQQLLDADVLGPNGEALVTGEPPKNNSNGGAIAGAVIGALLGVAVLAVCIFFGLKWKKKRQESQEIGGAYFNRSFDIDPDDEEIGLRQRYGVPSPRPTTSEKGKTTYSVHVDVGGLRSHRNSSRRENGGHNSLRNSARSDGRNPSRSERTRHQQQAMHYENPLADDYVINELGGTSVMPAGAEMMAYYGSRQNSPRDNEYEQPSRYHSPKDEEHGNYENYEEPYYEDNYKEEIAVMPPPLQSIGSSSNGLYDSNNNNNNPPHYVNTEYLRHSQAMSAEHSAALSLPPNGSNIDSGPSSSFEGVNPAASRLFFNPAYSLEGHPQDIAASIAPAYVKQPPRPLSGKDSNIGPAPTREARTAEPTVLKAPLPVAISRTTRAPINVPSAEDVLERRAKLDALRAAVKALEQETARQGGVPMPQQCADASGASTSAAAQAAGTTLITKQYIRPLKRQENTTPRTEFLPGRPTVPPLPISNMQKRPSRPRPGRAAPISTKFVVPQSDGLIKAHPGSARNSSNGAAVTPAPIRMPEVKQQPQRSSPGAAIVRGAKSMFNSIKSTVTPPKPSRGPSAIPGLPTKTTAVGGEAPSGDYNDVLARVEGALQRTGGAISPSKQGRGSARGGVSRIPIGPTGAQ